MSIDNLLLGAGLILLVVSIATVFKTGPTTVWRELSLATISGLVVGLAVFVIQFAIEDDLEALRMETRQGRNAMATEAAANEEMTVALPGQDLAEFNFSDTDLAEANLIDVDLTQADLTDADLTDARLDEAVLVDADLTGATLIGADLSGADLSGAELSGADLSAADLSGADLTGAVVAASALENAIFVDTTCPDGFVTETTCDGHLAPVDG